MKKLVEVVIVGVLQLMALPVLAGDPTIQNKEAGSGKSSTYEENRKREREAVEQANQRTQALIDSLKQRQGQHNTEGGSMLSSGEVDSANSYNRNAAASYMEKMQNKRPTMGYLDNLAPSNEDTKSQDGEWEEKHKNATGHWKTYKY